MDSPHAPVPKPRSRYSRDSLASMSSLERGLTGESVEPVSSNGAHLLPSPFAGNDAVFQPPQSGSNNGIVLPTLASITDTIATKIPSLAGFATFIGGSVPNAPPAPAPIAPPSIDSVTNNIAAHIPSLAGTAGTVVNPSTAMPNSASTCTPGPATHTDAVSLDSIVGSFSNIPGLAGMVNSVANPAVSSMTTPTAPPVPTPSLDQIGQSQTDIGALSWLVMSTLDQNSGVKLPPLEGSSEPSNEANSNTNKEQSQYINIMASWASQEEVETDSSNDEEDTGGNAAPPGADVPVERDPSSNTNNHSSDTVGRSVFHRPAPPPPRQHPRPEKTVKQKIPRGATIRVSRKKLSRGSKPLKSAVVRSSWLDVWKGFRYNVLWATMDGQLMALYKKRTDRFSEVLFHVSSITNVKKQDKGRFSVYFRKKHYDFMAHNEEVLEGWITSLLASRGQPSPDPPELHGQITIKDSRSRVYAAIWSHNLWIYPNKDSFQLGVASFSVPLNVATVKPTGKHAFALITPYKSFNISVDSAKDLNIWMDSLSASIRSALSCNQVAQRLWENPHNKVCGDCGAANPEWASVNLLLVICHACAGQHRALNSNLSKVRSLKMDNKVWTEPLMQLFVAYGNWLPNQVWAPAVTAVEQLHPESSDEERSNFIQDKYSRGRYRRVHALTSSPSMMDQRLRQVVCGDDIEETMSLICSGAKVSQSDPQSPSPIMLAEKAGQALQNELLRLNQYTDVPPYQPQATNRKPGSASSDEEEEELHGKLEEDRFLFSVENNSAACDVLDLREVLSVFLTDGPAHEFEIVTPNDQLSCTTDNQEALLSHLVHILKVILPGGVSYAEVGGASAVSKVCVVEMGGAHTDAWLLLWEDGVSVHPINRQTQQTLKMELSSLTHNKMDPSENIITIVTADRTVSFRFEEQHSCQSWFNHLQKALSKQTSAPHRPPPPAPIRNPHRQPLYPVMDVESRGSVPPAIERCISHVTTYGLKVEGVYRRCGQTSIVNRLVEVLRTSPNSAPLESDEQGVLNATSALKQYVRQQESLIPDRQRQQWLHAASISDERSRFSAYRRLLKKLSADNRATLTALFGHFYMIQVFSQDNKMSAQNLALVLVPTLFQTLNQDLHRLTRDFIIHHTLLFLTPGAEGTEEDEEQITVL